MAIFKLRPRTAHICFPGHQRAVVERAEIVHILQHEQIFRRSGHARRRRQHRVGKNIARDPRVAPRLRSDVADHLAEEKTLVFQATKRAFHVAAVILEPDMLEHSDAHDAVERFFYVAIILQPDFDRQTTAKYLGESLLLLGDRDADNCAAIILGRIFRQSAPATADVEQTHACRQSELTANQIHLLPLRDREIIRVAKVRARILHRRIEHCLEEIVAEVVVPLRDRAGAALGLQIQNDCHDNIDRLAKADSHSLFKMGPQRAKTHLIERRAIPPAIHVGLAEPERSTCEYPPVKALVMNRDVPWPLAIETNVGRAENVCDDFLGAGRGFARVRGHARLHGAPSIAVRCISREHHDVQQTLTSGLMKNKKSAVLKFVLIAFCTLLELVAIHQISRRHQLKAMLRSSGIS